MDDRDINELIDNINTAAAYVLRTDTTPGFARGYGSCTDTIVGLLRNYVAR